MQQATTRPAQSRIWIVGGLLALGIAAAALFVAQRRRPPGDVRPLGRSTTTIVPGVHMLAGLGPSAAYAIETPDGLVLIDSGLEPDAAPLKAELSRLGLDWRSIVAILLTHAHGDHVGGAEHLQAATGAKVYIGAGDAEVVRAGGPRDAVFSTFHMPDHSPHPTRVDVELKGDQDLRFGDVRIRALATPGHSPGSTCYLVEKGGLHALFTGDVIMQLESDETAGTYTSYLAPRYRGDARAFLATLQKLKELPAPDLVLPGHPFSDATPQSPRLSRARWERMLNEGIREIRAVLSRFEADGADFLDGGPKRLLEDLDYLGDRGGEAVYSFFAASELYLVNAPGGPGLGDWVERRLRQLGREPETPSAVLLTSIGPGTLAALPELVERSRCRVVVSADGVDLAKKSLPPGAVVVAADDLPETVQFPVAPISLPGRGPGSCAYAISLDGRSVLFTGKIPILFDYDSIKSLSADFSNSRGGIVEYLSSVQRLDALRPELWLPAVPSEGQNANLYDDQWSKEILANNYRTGYRLLERAR